MDGRSLAARLRARRTRRAKVEVELGHITEVPASIKLTSDVPSSQNKLIVLPSGLAKAKKTPSTVRMTVRGRVRDALKQRLMATARRQLSDDRAKQAGFADTAAQIAAEAALQAEVAAEEKAVQERRAFYEEEGSASEGELEFSDDGSDEAHTSETPMPASEAKVDAVGQKQSEPVNTPETELTLKDGYGTAMALKTQDSVELKQSDTGKEGGGNDKDGKSDDNSEGDSKNDSSANEEDPLQLPVECTEQLSQIDPAAAIVVDGDASDARPARTFVASRERKTNPFAFLFKDVPEALKVPEVEAPETESSTVLENPTTSQKAESDYGNAPARSPQVTGASSSGVAGDLFDAEVADDEGDSSDDDEGADSSDDNDDDKDASHKQVPKKDRSAGFRAILAAERAQVRDRSKRRSGLVEDEASEEELEDGVGDYGDGGTRATSALNGDDEDDDEDAIDRAMAREGISGIVDTLSDDEGDNNEEEYHAKMVMAEDALQLNAVARAVRSHNFRSRKNGRRGGFSRLDQFMDADDAFDISLEEEEDEEEAYLQQLEDERRLRKEEEEAAAAAGAGAEGDNDARQAAEDADVEFFEAKNIMERAKMQHVLRNMVPRSSSLLDKDEDSRAILGMLCRTNTRAETSRSVNFESSLEPETSLSTYPSKLKPQSVVAPSKAEAAVVTGSGITLKTTETNETQPSSSAEDAQNVCSVNGVSLAAEIVRSAKSSRNTATFRKRNVVLQRRGSFLAHHNPTSAPTQRSQKLTTISRKFVFSIDDGSASQSRDGSNSFPASHSFGNSRGGNSRSSNSLNGVTKTSLFRSSSTQGLMSALTSGTLQRATKRHRSN